MADHVDDAHGSSRSTGTATAEPAHSDAAAQAIGAPRPAALPDTLVLGPSTPGATVGVGSGSGFALTPAFDDHHPPDKELADDCVHCGFCLPACPTYLLWGEEMDSPRGRVYQMEAGLAGAPLDDTMVRHMDQCLGCMACVTACPSGVQYHKLIEATRAQIERRYRRPWTDRVRREVIFKIFPYPKRLRALRGPLRAYQASHLGALVSRLPMPALLKTMEALAPTLGRPPAIAPRTPAVGTRRHTVGLLLGCVQGAFFPDVNAATVRVLAAEGCEVIVPAGQGCCGALSAHSGREEESLRFARALIDTFDRAGVETVITNAAGCGSNMKDYGHLLRDDPAYAERAAHFARRVRDVTEYLIEIGPVATRHPLELRVAYHDPCHLQHAQGLRGQPRSLLTAIPGLELVEVAESEMCCGSAGIYNLLQPEAAAELGERKARHVLATGAELLVTGNPGCWMQIATSLARMGHLLPVTHTVQIVDASLKGLPAPAMVHQSRHGPGTPQIRR
jgi:glycolate oxidase iron-sulfur subunit